MTNTELEEAYKEHSDTSHEVGASLVATNFDNALDFAEIGLDSFVTDSVLKEIPIVKTIVGVVKSGLKVREIFFAKKILTFLKEFHSGKLPADKLEEFRQEFSSSEKYREKVLEQIMIFNDRFLEVEKSKVFANLFAAHLNGRLIWSDLIILNLCLERIDISSIKYLEKMEKFEQPFVGKHDLNLTVPLLISAGIVLTHLDWVVITNVGLNLYYYGFKGKIEGNVKTDYPGLFI